LVTQAVIASRGRSNPGPTARATRWFWQRRCPEAIAAGVHAQVRFFIAPEGQSRALVMIWRLDLPASEANDAVLPENRVVLLDHVRSVRFDYFEASDENRGAEWQESWSGRTRLPLLVRVQVERDDPALPPWPDLLSAPKATATPACVYDAVAASCRRIC
jgi:hypothetical protein